MVRSLLGITTPVLVASAALLVLPRVAAAEDAAAATTAEVTERPLGVKLHAISLEVGLDSAAPLRLTDTADMRTEPTRAFLFGGHVGVAIGDPLRDAHRLGVAIGYATVARSASRSLALVTPRLTYETGHPLMLQVGLGWAIPTGTAGFADQYGGVLTTAALRYSFRRAVPRSLVGATLGLTGQVVAATKAFERSSVFLGAQLDLHLQLGDGGSR